MSSGSYHRSVSYSGTICDVNITDALSQFVTQTHTHTHTHTETGASDVSEVG